MVYVTSTSLLTPIHLGPGMGKEMPYLSEVSCIQLPSWTNNPLCSKNIFSTGTTLVSGMVLLTFSICYDFLYTLMTYHSTGK